MKHAKRVDDSPAPRTPSFMQQTISRDLTISLVLAVLITSALLYGLTYWFVSRSARFEMEEKAGEYLSYLVDSLALPVWSMDEEGVRRIADSFMRGDLVALIRIRDTTNQQVLFEAHETGLDHLLIKERPIIFNQRVIGSVVVGLTPRPYENRLNALLRSNLRNTLLIVIILAIITSLFVRRYLRHPLNLLILGIEEVSRGNYSYAFPPFKQREIRTIVSKFRAMADQVQSRQQSLEDANRQLETEINERRAAETDLRQSEERFRALINQAADAIFVHDLNGRLIDVNQQACSVLGYRRDELLAMSFPDIDSHYAEQSFSASMTELISHKQLTHQSYLQRKDSAALPVEMRLGIIELKAEKAILVLARDITSRLQAEAALRDSHKTLLTVLDGIEAVIHVTDLETHEIMFCNKYMRDQYGENLVGQQCWKALRGLDEPCTDCRIGELLDVAGKPSGTIAYESQNPTSGRWYINYDRAIKWSNGGYVMLEMATDITEIKRMEEERQRTEARLQRAQRLEAIGTLAGGVAHDFNNLLMGIQGTVGLMLEEVSAGDPQAIKLKEIEDYLKRAVDLTNRLLGFAREGKYEIRPININKLVARTADLFGRTKKELAINTDFRKTACTVEADAGQVEQVLLNLFVNAWQAMPQGGTLTITTDHTDLAAAKVSTYSLSPGRYVKITVSDTGIGMDDETQQRIFDPFFTTKEVGAGTGLGLASAYGIITNHQGIIEVDSDKMHGTTFTIFLPATDLPAIEKPTRPTARVSGSETLLLVDDEEMILKVGAKMLARLGYTVLTARTGPDAIAIYEREKDTIAMVILDMIMPVMSGHEIFERLKEINPQIKTLLSSGYSIDGQAAEILQRGCNGFIQKPFTLEAFSQKIRDILDAA
jgi:two-component system, cell cycle sensor histidine kinase and response regulator CckA